MSKNEEFTGFVKIMRDLTERVTWEATIKKYVRELEELNEHKENILSIISHDLRTPLGIIVSGTDLLKFRSSELSEDFVNIIDSQHNSANRQMSMLDNLLQWARVKYASEIFSPKNIKLKDSLTHVLNLLED
jgi:signal transduction histidine kinase